ncbi:MAG TPA: tryptophan--tRNA ligase [Candidatus Saccharimonadales bacterium]|nr:tryptophan--tRNA ligase [Candidatus Saccharimonadales bacterium]
MQKEVILTGIRANNDLHIGNYFGALLPMIDMAKSHSSEYEINLFVPDLHSFTTPIDHNRLQGQIMHNLKLFVAAGLPLDNDSIHIYRQSYIPAHSEMTWILDCFTGFGEMSRMTQFKDKSSKMFEDFHELKDGKVIARPEKNVSVGLFNYPVLMAADILLYGAKYVPVGDDQTQHLEFTRDIAERMNKQFGELFTVPEPVAKQHQFFGKDQGLRIKDLTDPTKKMSKSDESGRGIIFLGDDPETAVSKIMSATTDSESVVGTPDINSRPGVANLVQILKLLDPEVSNVENMSYKEFKETVADAVKKFLSDFQAKLAAVDEQKLMSKLESDEKAMTEIADATLLKVQKAVGLRP